MSGVRHGGYEPSVLISVEEVIDLVEAVERIQDDDESAHALEDDIWEAVLRAIAEGADDAKGLAAAALKTQDFGFSRWCA